MDKVTREQKREQIDMYVMDWEHHHGKGPDDIARAILADYAPITDERRAELESRASLVDWVLNDKTRFGWNADFLRAWLAEIDAELEGA